MTTTTVGGTRRLVTAEASRLLSRRFTLVALLLVLLAVAAFQLAVNASLRPATAAEEAAAQTEYVQAHQEWEANERTCAGDGNPPDCAYPEPTPSDYSYAQSFAEVADESLQVTIYLTALAGLMVGGSFIGAEYSSGSVANWLTFVPRRGRVFVSKLITLVGFSALVGALASALALGAAVVLAQAYGLAVPRLTGELGLAGRGLLAVVALSVVGFCVGLVARHTAAAIGLLLGYLLAWFVRTVTLGEQAWAQRLTPWAPEANLSAVVDRGHTYVVPTRVVGPEGLSTDYVERTIGFTHGLVYWGVLLTVLVLVTALVFRRRDVS